MPIVQSISERDRNVIPSQLKWVLHAHVLRIYTTHKGWKHGQKSPKVFLAEEWESIASKTPDAMVNDIQEQILIQFTSPSNLNIHYGGRFHLPALRSGDQALVLSVGEMSDLVLEIGVGLLAHQSSYMRLTCLLPSRAREQFVPTEPATRNQLAWQSYGNCC